MALGRARGARSPPHVQPWSLATPARFGAVWPRSQALSCPCDLRLPPASYLRSCWLLSLIQMLRDHVRAAAVTRLGKKGACGCYLGGREIKRVGAAVPHRGNVFMSANSNQRTGAVCFISARGVRAQLLFYMGMGRAAGLFWRPPSRTGSCIPAAAAPASGWLGAPTACAPCRAVPHRAVCHAARSVSSRADGSPNPKKQEMRSRTGKKQRKQRVKSRAREGLMESSQEERSWLPDTGFGGILLFGSRNGGC